MHLKFIVLTMVSLFVFTCILLLNNDASMVVEEDNGLSLNISSSVINNASLEQKGVSSNHKNGAVVDGSPLTSSSIKDGVDDNGNQQNISTFHLDDILSEDETHILFNSTGVETLTASETRGLLTELSSNLTQSTSIEKLDVVSSIVNQYTLNNSNISLDSLECSDKLCGIFFSSMAKSDVNTALMAISSNPDIKRTLQGGTIRIFKETGLYYGVIISSIGDKPTKVY